MSPCQDTFDDLIAAMRADVEKIREKRIEQSRLVEELRRTRIDTDELVDAQLSELTAENLRLRAELEELRPLKEMADAEIASVLEGLSK